LPSCFIPTQGVKMGGVCGVPPHKHPPNPLFEGICCQKMSYAIALSLSFFT
jgi:hypothetical protein